MNIDISEGRNRHPLYCHEFEPSADDGRMEMLREKTGNIRWNIFVDLHRSETDPVMVRYDNYSGIVCNFRLNDLIWRMLRGTVHDHDDFLA